MSRRGDDLGLPPLNVQPIGLLDFMQIKNGGRTPQILEPTLQPTWDLQRHYLETNALISQVTRTYASGDNTFISFDTAVSQWRFINWWAWQWNPLNALDAISGWPCLLAEDNLTRLMLPFEPISGGNNTNRWFATAGAVLRSVLGRTRDSFWVPPGYTIGWLQFDGVSTGGLANISSRISGVSFRA